MASSRLPNLVLFGYECELPLICFASRLIVPSIPLHMEGATRVAAQADTVQWVCVTHYKMTCKTNAMYSFCARSKHDATASVTESFPFDIP